MNITIKDLFELCKENNTESIVTENGNEVFKVNSVSILTYGNRYVNVKAISRHLVHKTKYRIGVKCIADQSDHYIETTNDHTCIRVTDYNVFENIKASDISIYDLIPINVNGAEYIGQVFSVKDMGNWDEYVYDLEVDEGHCFYANNILIHNSQFINISPIVENYISTNNLSNNDMSSLTQEHLDKLINELDEFVENDVNKYIINLVNTECHTKEGHNLHYSREYVASQAMFFKKKNYIAHIIKLDDKNIDKFKYCGVSCKKTEIPSDMKYFLKNIFEDTCIKKWNEADYRKYIDTVFDQFLKKSYEDISLYKTYNTEKASTGFMESEKGAGAHARSANIYNQLLEDMKLTNKYEKIGLGDTLRYCYINSTNPYGINVIAFKEYMPVEFMPIFTINYELMFEKIFLSSLKGYINIMRFNEYSPNNKSICDISDL